MQRNSITRVRPAIKQGWEIAVDLMVLLPEYITPELLADTIGAAGRLVGLADFRPTYGRFVLTHFDVAGAE